MAIVSRPDQGNKVALYDIPDDELARYEISPEKLVEMFPHKESRSRADAIGVAPAGTQDIAGDVQGYGGQDICYAWECDSNGKCVYIWWYC